MQDILIICDDEVLTQLYTTNIEVYLNGVVTKAKTIKHAIDYLKNEVEFHLIITMSEIEGVNALDELKNAFQLTGKIVPIITIGERQKNSDDNIFQVESYYNISETIKLASKILNITAKEMALKNVNQYYPIDIEFALFLKKTPVNLLIEVKRNNEKEYSVFAKVGSHVEGIIQKLKAEGVEKIFVFPNDRLFIINTISESICEFLKEGFDLPHVQKIENLELSMNFIVKNLVSTEVSNELINLVGTCSSVMKDIVNQTNELSVLLKVFSSNKNNYGFVHSMLGAYVAAHIVRHVSWGGESQIEKINFVLFFHDIYLAPIFVKYPEIQSEEDMIFSDLLSIEEKEMVLNHARKSAELVIGIKKCPLGADLLIKQHHGMINGIGFAIDFKDDISPLSKIIIVSEAFVEELLKQKKIKSDVSIENILNALKEKFPKHTYLKLVDTLKGIKI